MKYSVGFTDNLIYNNDVQNLYTVNVSTVYVQDGII